MRGMAGASGRLVALIVASATGLTIGWMIGRQAGGANAGRSKAPAVVGGSGDRIAYESASRLQEVLDLRGRVDRLTASLADVEARVDREAFRGASAGRGSVLTVDERLGLVVVSGGAGSGRRRGQVMQIERDGVWVARIRVVEVRSEVSGARVEAVRPGWAPRRGDRVDADAWEQRER